MQPTGALLTMKRTIAGLTIAAALAVTQTADAHSRGPHLSIRAARAAIASDANGGDQPQSLTIRHCHRASRTAVRCKVVEYGVQTYWTLDGKPFTMTLTSSEIAKRTRHGIRVSSTLLWFTS